jgi:carbamate kinase
VRIVAALGGNARLCRGEPLDLPTERANARVAARALAELARGHELIVTHGNGHRSVCSPSTPDEPRALSLPAGSMAPKSEAAARFVAATAGQAAIWRLEDAPALLASRAGTTVRTSRPARGWQGARAA